MGAVQALPSHTLRCLLSVLKICRPGAGLLMALRWASVRRGGKKPLSLAGAATSSAAELAGVLVPTPTPWPWAVVMVKAARHKPDSPNGVVSCFITQE